jgi:hypothetical protein
MYSPSLYPFVSCIASAHLLRGSQRIYDPDPVQDADTPILFFEVVACTDIMAECHAIECAQLALRLRLDCGWLCMSASSLENPRGWIEPTLVASAVPFLMNRSSSP